MTHFDGIIMLPAVLLQEPTTLAAYQVVALAQSALLAAVIMVLEASLVRALARRLIDRRPVPPPLPAEVTDRLERIEQAVDAIALEVERIAEAQRYAAKLMTESATEARDAGRLPPSRTLDSSASGRPS